MYASAWFSHDTAGLWCRLCSYTPWTLCYIASSFCQLSEFHNLDVSHVHVLFWQWYIQYFLGSNVLNFTTVPCELTQIKKKLDAFILIRWPRNYIGLRGSSLFYVDEGRATLSAVFFLLITLLVVLTCMYINMHIKINLWDEICHVPLYALFFHEHINI